MYKVICRFADKEDENYIYEVGDVYPRDGKKVTEERIAVLASANNSAQKVLIEEVAEKVPEITEEVAESKTKTKK